MPRKPTYRAGRSEPNGATLGFEAKLWQAADKLRNNMDAAEYKHVVLGLIFLKYISDAFEGRHAQIERGTADPASEWYVKDPQHRYAVMEDRDEYLAANIFWVPKEARWLYLQANAKQPAIGKQLDDAMVAIERDNKVLKGVLAVRSLVEPLQIGMDNSARRALIPIENKRHFLDVPADIMERIDPIFYGDPLTAAMKALGMS